MDKELPLLKGTVDMLVLKALTWGPPHGFGISHWLDDRSSGGLGLDDSSMYQALHRLEERGWVDAEWRVTDNNRRARYSSSGALAARRTIAQLLVARAARVDPLVALRGD